MEPSGFNSSFKSKEMNNKAMQDRRKPGKLHINKLYFPLGREPHRLGKADLPLEGGREIMGAPGVKAGGNYNSTDNGKEEKCEETGCT